MDVQEMENETTITIDHSPNHLLYDIPICDRYFGI